MPDKKICVTFVVRDSILGLIKVERNYSLRLSVTTSFTVVFYISKFVIKQYSILLCVYIRCKILSEAILTKLITANMLTIIEYYNIA